MNIELDEVVGLDVPDDALEMVGQGLTPGGTSNTLPPLHWC